MPYKRGAPAGNTNHLKHGRFCAAALVRRRLVRETIRSARLALMEAEFAVRFAEAAPVRDTPVQENR